MRDVKLGNYAVIANDHTLVLGWNSAAVPLLRQMAMTKAQYPKPNALQRCDMSMCRCASLEEGHRGGPGAESAGGHLQLIQQHTAGLGMAINTVVECVSSSCACSLGLLGPGPGLRAEPVFEGPVVILAEHAKDEMDASVSGAASRLLPWSARCFGCAPAVCTSGLELAICLPTPRCITAWPCLVGPEPPVS